MRVVLSKFEVMRKVKRLILLILLRISRGSFLKEDSQLKSYLAKNGFHVSLCTHPSILFKQRKHCISILPNPVIRLVCFFLRHNYGVLTAERWHPFTAFIGISDYFINHLEFIVYNDNDYKKYDVPNRKISGKIVVYTALTGEYDDVHELLYKEPNVDYLLFTNNPNIRSKTWEVHYVDSTLDNLLLSREIKMLPHKYVKDYDYSVYVDANAFIYGDIAQLTSLLSDTNTFAVTKHRINKSIKEEIESCVKSKGIFREAANEQYNSYLQRGFKDNLGLAECGILVRIHNDPKLISLMERWWQEFQNGVKRDQLSLMACIYLEQFKAYSLIDGCVFHNQYCIIGGHNKLIDNE